LDYPVYPRPKWLTKETWNGRLDKTRSPGIGTILSSRGACSPRTSSGKRSPGFRTGRTCPTRKSRTLEAGLRSLFSRFPTDLSPNESQTEDDLIWPVLARS